MFENFPSYMVITTYMFIPDCRVHTNALELLDLSQGWLPGWTEKLICNFFRYKDISTSFRGVFSFLKPGWLGGENVLQVKHFDACTLYFLKSRGGWNHPNHPGNYTPVQSLHMTENSQGQDTSHENWIKIGFLYNPAGWHDF